MTVLEDAYAKACEVKANDINSFVWKGPKINGVQEEYKLIDADYATLRKYYKHCEEMLYNTNAKNPGRRTLLNIVSDQIQRCRAELLIRWLRAEKSYTNTRCLEDLRTIIRNNKEDLTQEAIKTYPIGYVMSGLPIDYERVPISLVMDACLDSLGILDSTHVTLNFIVKMGLWFTPQEMQNPIDKGGLYKKDPNTGKAMNRLEVVAAIHRLNPTIKLRIDKNTGLSYAEFRDMYNLRKDKYVNLTSSQLKLMSNKILYRFQDQCAAQAEQWEAKIAEIVKVAEYKGWDVTRDIE